MTRKHFRAVAVVVLFMAMLAAVAYGIASAAMAHADPTPTPDPGEAACYRGALACLPPYWSSRGDADQGPPCLYVLGAWRDAYGNRCSSGATR